jgi:Kef-type K+ transport system membrane component KefB
MESILPFLLALSLIIFLAKAAGYVSVRLHQPAVLGELLMGLILGPTVLDLLGREPFLHGGASAGTFLLADLGVIFLMFMAGLEVDLEQMRTVGKTAVYAGTMGIVFPLALGVPTALAFGYSSTAALFIALILTATSVSISAQTLMELGFLRSREGLALLGAAVVDDVLVVLLLSGFLATFGHVENQAIGQYLLIGVRIVLYLLVAAVIGVFLLTPVVRKVSTLPISEGVIALVIVVTLLFAWASEAIGGMAAITGSFLAGLFFARTPLRRRIEEGMHTITYGLLVPVFFVSIGLRANGQGLGASDLVFALTIIVVAVLGKIVGCGLGARASGFNTNESLRVGVGMVSRGEVGLIVAATGLEAGLIDNVIFSSAVLVVLATTLLTPLLLRSAFRGKEQV